MEIVTSVLLMLTGMFLILLILLQRGGGGLVNAFNSTSATSVCWTERVFPRITAAVAVVWIVVAGVSIYVLS